MFRIQVDTVNKYFYLDADTKCAIRTACALVLATVIVFYFHFNEPFWALISVIILINPIVATTIEKVIMRAVGTVAGAIFGYLLAAATVNHLPLFLLALFLVIVICVYLAFYSNHPYTYVLFAITVFIIMASVVENPSDPFNFAVWRTVEVLVGIGVSLICLLLIFPTTAKESFADEMTTYSRLMSELFGISANAFSPDHPLERAELKHKLNQVRNSVASCLVILDEHNKEYTSTQLEHDLLVSLITQMQYLVRRIRILNIHYDSSLNYSILVIPELEIGELNAAMVNLLDMLTINNFNTQAVRHKFSEAHRQLRRSQQWFMQLRRQNAFEKFPKDERPIAMLYLQDIDDILQQVDVVIIAFEKYLHCSGHSQRIRRPTFHSKIVFDKLKLQQAIKVGLSGILSIALWFLFGWPGGLQGIVTAFILAQTTHLYEWQNKAYLRLVGCFIGGAVGIIALSLIQVTLFDLLFLLFFFSLVFAFITHKSTRFSYLGLQANIALAMTMVQTQSQPVNVVLGLQRLSGITLGIVATMIVGYMVWPIHPRDLLAKKLRELYQNNIYLLLDILHSFETLNYKQMQARYFNEFRSHFDKFYEAQAVLTSMQQMQVFKRERISIEEHKLIVLRRIGLICYDIAMHLDLRQIVSLARLYGINMNVIVNSTQELLNMLQAEPDRDQQHIKQKLAGITAQLEPLIHSAGISPYRLRLRRELITNYLSFVTELKQMIALFDDYLELGYR